MPITPQGPLSVPLTAVRTLLANTAQFQAWTGEATAAAAEQHIYLVGLPQPANADSFTPADFAELRPFVVLDYDLKGDGFRFPSLAQGQFQPSGKILCSFEGAVPAEDQRNFDAVTLDFLNNVGLVMQQALELADTGGGAYPVIHESAVRYGPRRASLEERTTRGDFMIAIISFEIGLT